MKRFTKTRLFVLTLLFIVGCGEHVVGEDLPDAAQTICDMAAEAVCQAACDCQDSDKCYVSYGGVATVAYENLQHCMAFRNFECKNSSGTTIEILACVAAVPIDTCETDTHEGTPQEMLVIPQACIEADQ